MTAPSPAEYIALADEVSENLRRHVLALWFPRAVDASGGFHQNYDLRWQQGADDGKGVVYQSRLVYMAAQAAIHFPAERAAYETYIRHGLRFLADRLWDASEGGFFWALDANGVPVRGGEKHAYGISFAVYACAAVYEATGAADALALAGRALGWLDAHAHDGKNGGYYESLSRAGTPLLSPPPEQRRDCIGSPYGMKTMNTHIHLLESFTALHAAQPDALLRVRLEELFRRVRDTIVVASVGCQNLYFTPEWRPLPDHDSFGHDVETAFLLTDAARVLGIPDDPETWRAARSLVDHALEYGWDAAQGGLFDSGTAFGSPTNTEKTWWVQAESLNALLLMHTRFGAGTDRYWEAFKAQWAFIQTRQVDHENSGWYSYLRADGTPVPGRGKSDGWTDPYHQGRALLHVAGGLRGLGGL